MKILSEKFIGSRDPRCPQPTTERPVTEKPALCYPGKLYFQNGKFDAEENLAMLLHVQVNQTQDASQHFHPSHRLLQHLLVIQVCKVNDSLLYCFHFCTDFNKRHIK